MKELQELDDDSLLEWGRQREKIIKLVDEYCTLKESSIEKAKENASRLFEEIIIFNDMARKRSRITAAIAMLELSVAIEEKEQEE